MAGKTYIGVSNISKEPNKIYAGVNGIAKDVKAIYVGDSNGIARMVWPNSSSPVGYQRVEYISNGTVGTQTRINTNYYSNPYTKVYIKFLYPTSTSSYPAPFFNSPVGNDPDNINNSTFSLIARTGNSQGIRFYFYNKTSDWVSRRLYSSTIYECTFNDYGRFYLDGDLVYTATDYTGTTSERPIRLFPTYSNSLMRLYALKIWSNGTQLVRDMRPCYRKSDGVNGLYDMVNNTFYVNEDTSHLEYISRGPEIDWESG